MFALLAPFWTPATPGLSLSLPPPPLSLARSLSLALPLPPSPSVSLSDTHCCVRHALSALVFSGLTADESSSDTAPPGTRYQRGVGCSAQRTPRASWPPPWAPGCPKTRRPLTSQQHMGGTPPGRARRVRGVDGGVGSGGGQCGGELRRLSGCDALNLTS